MISLKTKEEAKKMRRSGEIAAFAINQLVREVRVGITTLELDKIAKRLIEARGAKSAFLDYNGYNYTICVSINDEVVHGLPSSRQIKDGDIVSIDLGVLYNGYFADTAKSVIVGNATVEAKRVVFGVKEALEAAIKEARPGVKIGDIENASGEVLKKHGLSAVMALSGHGIGTQIHEEPSIKSDGTRGTGETVKAGMVFALEPMATIGSGDVFTAPDGWTVKSKDQSIAAHFEHTVLIAENGAKILTKAH